MRIACLVCLLFASIANARPPHGYPGTGSPFIGACPVTVGTLTLAAITPRATGISPLAVWFDATGTTDTATLAGANNTFQDVTYTWNFGDGGVSGTGTWAYGSNPGVNSMNAATGGIAAHVYITNGADTPYTATVTATDGTNTAQCNVAVTAYDPSGSNGFPGTETTCVAASTTPVAGSGGCPSGAAVLQQADFVTALNSKFGSNKRVLFHCGDTFPTSSTYYHINGVTTASIGAYGGCQNTQTSRPIFSDQNDSIDSQLQTSMTSGDIRIADIDFEGTSNPTAAGPNGAVGTDATGFTNVAYQFTLWNLKSYGNKGGYATQQSAQWAIVGCYQANVNDTYISTFLNTQGTVNMPITSGPVLNQSYLALIGDYFDGPGNGAGSTSGFETVRISYADLAFISNSTFLDANNYGAVLKIHENNGGNGVPWTGIYTQYVDVSDNYFGGSSAANMVEHATTGASDDERLRYFVNERNFYVWGSSATSSGDGLLLNAQYASVRDNVFYMTTITGGFYQLYGLLSSNETSSLSYAPEFIEAYNNTCYSPTVHSTQTCISYTPKSGATAASNSFAKNNLFYANGSGTNGTVTNTGSGNTVSNNTVTVTANPAFTDGSGIFSLITDFKPTANYTGGASVPVFYDAILSSGNPYGVPWPPTWDLGAVHH